MSHDRPPTAALTDAAHRSSASFELVLGPVLMALIGLLVDSWAGTRPWFTVVFAVWGMAGAGVLVYYRYRQQMEAVRATVVRSSAPGDASSETPR
jgi:F0F1-type ATP synthase assembly protein I